MEVAVRTIGLAIASLSLLSGTALASEWDLCPTLTLMQVYGLVGRTDLASMSQPQMIHGTCTSLATSKTGEKLGISIDFSVQIFDPSGGDPNTNPNPPQYPVSLQQWKNQSAPFNESADGAFWDKVIRQCVDIVHRSHAPAYMGGDEWMKSFDAYRVSGTTTVRNNGGTVGSQPAEYIFNKCLNDRRQNAR